MALQAILYEGSQPRRKTLSFIEVDKPSDLKKRPFLRGIGRLLAPTRGTVDALSWELSGTANASPLFSPYCARNPQDLPWRIDEPSHHRA